MRRKENLVAALIGSLLPLLCTAARSGAFALPPTAAVEVSVRGNRHWRDPYVAEWSGGQDARLVITGNTIKYGNDKPVPYHDVTRVTNGREFRLEITSKLSVNIRSNHASNDSTRGMCFHAVA